VTFSSASSMWQKKISSHKLMEKCTEHNTSNCLGVIVHFIAGTWPNEAVTIEKAKPKHGHCTRRSLNVSFKLIVSSA
jgi:hypothetical protein